MATVSAVGTKDNSLGRQPQVRRANTKRESRRDDIDANFDESNPPFFVTLRVRGPLTFARFETANVAKQTILHLGMVLIGRWLRTAVRKLLQRRLIVAGRQAPVRLTRKFEFLGDRDETLRVTDTIELTDPKARVRRMSFGADHQAAYVAAGAVYQEGALGPWTDLSEYVTRLNARRQVTIVREFAAGPPERVAERFAVFGRIGNPSYRTVPPVSRGAS